MRGLMVTLEGINGGGKTTQARRLVDHYNAMGRTALYVRAPGQTPIGQEIRNLVLHKGHLISDPYTRQALFLADHNELLTQVVLPALEAGTLVIADRFLDSTTAYAVGGLQLDATRIACMIESQVLCASPSEHPEVPDLTLLLTLPVESAMERSRARNETDHAPEFDQDYYARVASAFAYIYERNRHRCRLVNADRPPDEVFAKLCEWIDAFWKVQEYCEAQEQYELVAHG